MPTQSQLVDRIGDAASRATAHFIPPGLLHSTTNGGLARIFVQTQFGVGGCGLILVAYLAARLPGNAAPLAVLGALFAMMLALPSMLRRTENLSLTSLASFQVMAVASLIGVYQFGGFASPFLPWLMVSLLFGLFYQSRRTGFVLALFATNIAVFAVMVALRGTAVHATWDLMGVSWLSITAAILYMAYMALFYARIIGSRYELEAESERYRAALVDLEQVKVISERISRNRSQFFSKMSHELRTPLNAIIGYSEILLEDCEDGPEDKHQYVPDLKRINATGRHLLSLVAGVLDVDNLEKETSRLELGNFTLGGLADDVVATASPLIGKNGNRLEVSVPMPNDTVHSDEKKLRQMLINLLSNAGKFTRNGTVKFELWVERSGADDRLHAVVTDTGIGIAPDVLPKLFDAYMQADETIHSRFGGTGIGLALTRKFAVLLGGEIKATSKVGAGSRFEIDVPAKLQIDNPKPASLAA